MANSAHLAFMGAKALTLVLRLVSNALPMGPSHPFCMCPLQITNLKISFLKQEYILKMVFLKLRFRG